VGRGCISKEQLKQALDIQQQEGGKLGQVLVRMGLISDAGLRIAEKIITVFLDGVRPLPQNMHPRLPPYPPCGGRCTTERLMKRGGSGRLSIIEPLPRERLTLPPPSPPRESPGHACRRHKKTRNRPVGFG
jgi:hypothetical protein